MHRAALIGRDDTLCTLEEGRATLQLIEAAEQASRQLEWVRR
jgi:hypothetical protein